MNAPDILNVGTVRRRNMIGFRATESPVRVENTWDVGDAYAIASQYTEEGWHRFGNGYQYGAEPSPLNPPFPEAL